MIARKKKHEVKKKKKRHRSPPPPSPNVLFPSLSIPRVKEKKKKVLCIHFVVVTKVDWTIVLYKEEINLKKYIYILII